MSPLIVRCGRSLRKNLACCGALLVLTFLAGNGWAQMNGAPARAGGLRGQVTDPTGAVVVGAEIVVTTPGGATQKTLSDKQGNYLVRGLPTGTVTVRVTSPGFAPYEMPNVIIPTGEMQRFDIALGIAVEQEQVTVQSESGGAAVDVSPENNASALILRGEDLEALPDDPDELQQDLLALAGPSVGPNGGQIFIDGFTGGTLPPKSSIREIRINQNPFSAEYDKPGYGRVEVFTKPGTELWHGQAMFDENNSALNSRNPYLHGPVPGYHSEIYNGNVSGAVSKKMSIFLNAERRNISELGVVAPIPSLGLPNGEAVPSPQRRNNFSGRLDWQVTPNNTLTARYQFESNDQENLGVGGLTLPTRGYSSNGTEHTVQISDTQIVSPHVINETRFQFIRNETSQTGNGSGAAINVLGEFNGGGSTVGQYRDTNDRYELQNYTSWAVGKHFVKFGGRLRVVHDDSFAPTNFNGTFTFGQSPNNGPTPLQNFQSGTPTQFSIVTGNPHFVLPFADAAVYGEDDWTLRPNLIFSYGLRFETQSSIGDHADFAPRVVLSWGLGSGKRAPKTVLRFGSGIFYDRFTYDLVEQAERQNGVNEIQGIFDTSQGSTITCPPSPTTLQPSDCTVSGTLSPTIYQVNPNLRAPYTIQNGVSLEQQLGRVGTISLTYLNSIGDRQLILINANAPACEVGGVPVEDCLPSQGGSRPLAAQFGNANLYQYNSNAIFRQNQLITNVQIRVSQKLSLIGFYTLNYANSDTGGPNSSPSNQFNLLQDYGRASFDVRHRLFFAGSASLAHNIRISPFVIFNSGAPFNITTGQDNGSTFYNQRPSFGNTCTPFGCFNPNPSPGDRPIPINFGDGPANLTLNVRLSKTFGFGEETSKPEADQEQGHGGHHGGSRGGGFGAPHGMGGVFGPESTSRRYNLTLTVMARNVLNTWNPGTPIGNLSSSQFGKSVSLAGGPFSSGTANRRVDFQALFSF